MRFGAFVPQGWRLDLTGIERTEHWETMTTVARSIEQSGFESLWVYDHFHTVPAPTQEATYEAWTLMASLAAVTSLVRLGQMCTCNTYRPPSYLAKVAASIDVISGGRLEMGIGAGWYEHEHEGYGYPFLEPGPRIRMLEEGVEIMKAMWTEEVVHYEGRHYRLEGAICQPKPLQSPHIPLWVAGGGEQLTLRVAARHAQYTNFGIKPEWFTHKSEVLAAHCRDVGRDFEEITRSANFNIICAGTEAEVADRIGALQARLEKYVPPAKAEEQIRLYRHNSGTPEQVITSLKEWEALGLAYAIVYFPDAAYDLSGLELFAREVVPAFR
ncbi:MAG TPA: LLM class F420-dependent oxidoreductase [Acidimicrobiia bacterium]|nr:LLM class F420-dependent oxidoreductase [Acidimicrobiia bacterium]